MLALVQVPGSSQDHPEPWFPRPVVLSGRGSRALLPPVLQEGPEVRTAGGSRASAPWDRLWTRLLQDAVVSSRPGPGTARGQRARRDAASGLGRAARVRRGHACVSPVAPGSPGCPGHWWGLCGL